MGALSVLYMGVWNKHPLNHRSRLISRGGLSERRARLRSRERDRERERLEPESESLPELSESESEPELELPDEEFPLKFPFSSCVWKVHTAHAPFT